MILYEFDDCYRVQDFYKQFPHKKMDFTLLEGVNGYCDDDAKEMILNVMQQKDDSLQFWGNGNYHYMSYLALQKVQFDFSLLVFDHHPDMQPSFFEELLSCGCWIKHALEKLEHLKQVVVLGVKKELLEELAQTEGFLFLGKDEYSYRYEKNGKSILCIEESFFVDNLWESFDLCGKLFDIPVYVSVDKDVLSEKDCITNWDSGSMRFDTMMQLLEQVSQSHSIFAMDVCGEWDGIERIEKNNQCNEKLANWWHFITK